MRLTKATTIDLLARLSRGREAARMVSAPLIRPDAPILAMTRPLMSIAEDWAAPQTAEPISKIAKNVMNDHYGQRFSVLLVMVSSCLTFSLKFWYIFPVNGCRTALNEVGISIDRIVCTPKWFRPTFRVDRHFHTNQYPIHCELAMYVF